jgi:cytochrome c oxidase subunit IV
MATKSFTFQNLSRAEDRLETGGRLIAIAGVAVFIYGIVFLILNFTSFIETGLSPQLVGGDAQSIQGFSPGLYRYISHLQVNIAAFIIGNGMMLTALAWFGVRRGARWALWTALLAYMAGLVVGLPIHYAYGLATLVHVGPFYLVTALVLIGSGLAYSGLPRFTIRSDSRSQP